LAGRKRVDERLLRLAVAVQADGSITASGRVRLGFTKQRKIDRLRSLLRADEYSETVNSNGDNPPVAAFSLPRALSDQVTTLLDAKRLPWWWLDLTHELRAVAVQEAALWDGHQAPEWRQYLYASSIEQNVDVLQALASSVGMKTRKVLSPTGWRLSVKPRCRTRGGNLEARVEAHTGEVACLSVPSSFVLVRDGGVPVVTGQSFNFGIMYGMQDPTIAHNAGCDLATARMIRQAVLGKFRKFAAWIQQCLAYTRKTGIAWAYWHKRKAHQRQLPKIGDADDGMRVNAENSSYNTPVQGTASFYCLASVTGLVRWILANKIDAKVVATVHDSIVIEVRADLLERVARKMKTEMEGHPTFTGVPLAIDMKVGPTWGSMIEYSLPEEQAADLLGGPEAMAAMSGGHR
jgi:hypothetical protein